MDSYMAKDDVVFAPYAYMTAGTAGEMTAAEMFAAQSRLIRRFAQEKPGVFLGRCANYVLKDMPHTYSFYLYADDDYRRKEGREYYQGESLEELKARDEQRNIYYRQFTGTRRDDPQYYDMEINVGKTGIDGAVQIIVDYVTRRENRC